MPIEERIKRQFGCFDKVFELKRQNLEMTDLNKQEKLKDNLFSIWLRIGVLDREINCLFFMLKREMVSIIFSGCFLLKIPIDKSFELFNK